MSTYVSSNQPVGPERGTWVWLPLTPESDLVTDFNNTESPFTTPIDTTALDSSNPWTPANASLFAPYSSPDMDAALLDPTVGLDMGDLGSVLDITNLFPPEAPNADYAWMGQGLEAADLIELDPYLVAEIDRQVAEVTLEQLLPAASQLPDLAGLDVNFPTASVYTPITPSPSASGPSPPPSCASPTSGAAATAGPSYSCPEPSCTMSFPNPHQLRYMTPSNASRPQAKVDFQANLRRRNRKHERKHTRPFVCSECHKGHAAKKDLHRHLWVRHPEVAERSGIPCEVRRCHVRGCDFEGRQDNLKRHMRTKHR